MRWTHLLTIAIAILLLAACGPRRAQVEPPRPTITPVPTFTLTPAGAAVAVSGGQNVQQTQTQVQPAATAVPAATPTPSPPMVTIGTTQMNVRAGPSLLYQIIGQAYPGEEFEVTGKNPGLGDWWEIKYRSDAVRGWVYSQLVIPRDTQNVTIAAVIPVEPTRTPLPPPTATPIPAPTQPPAPQFPYSIVNEGICPGNAQQTFFEGNVFGKDRLPKNGVCVHISFHGPRNTKCTGCGKPAGAWGFSPFGGPANRGTYVEIWIVNCPAGGWDGLRHNSKDFTNLAPLSQKWTATVNDSVGCRDINFREN